MRLIKMATREENLKKINSELEKLDDEELDAIAGGDALPIIQPNPQGYYPQQPNQPPYQPNYPQNPNPGSWNQPPQGYPQQPNWNVPPQPRNQ